MSTIQQFSGGFMRNTGRSLLLLAMVAGCRSVQPAGPQSGAPAAPAGTVPTMGTQPAPPRMTPPDGPARVEPQPLSPPALPLQTTPSVRDAFRASVDSMVNDPQFRNAHWGILIVDPDRGDTLYAHNADKLFMPASNQKIVTGAVGLTQLGPDFVWKTPVELRGANNAGTFTGDIVLHGSGDPSWSDALRSGDAQSAFVPVADALQARGIKRVVGSIVAEGNAFRDAPYGFGWAYDDFDFGYSAPVDELFFNEGFFSVTVTAAKSIAKPVTVSTRPLLKYPKVVVQAVTRERADSIGENRELRVTWDSTASAVVVSGSLPLGDSAKVDLAYRHPNDAAVVAMQEFLVKRGIVFSKPKSAKAPVAWRDTAKTAVQVGRTMMMPAPTVLPDTLAVLTSPPLRDVLKRLEKPSQNQLAEILYKTIALQRTGVGGADSARAVVQRQLVEWGVAPEAIAVRDGSGLSRHDYVAPRTLVTILHTMRKSPFFDAFYESLPIAGVDGTIAGRMRNTPAATNVHAKTGTVDKARSLSGYVTTADGQMLVFSFLCNNFTVPTRAVERVQDAISVRLASMRMSDWRAVAGR
ncbi:MAG: D-alanyl-D-alanine carboxypeptidase/D-alanyl-D-alanine endopeptidase [Gemmatimonas sp.]